MSGSFRKRCLFPGFHCRTLFVFAIASAAVAYAVTYPLVLAQSEQDSWDGTVDVSPTTLTIKPGGSASYSVKLSEAPIQRDMEDDGWEWWVTLVVDCKEYAEGYCGKSRDDYEIRWIPSRGRTFDEDFWDSGKISG